MTCVPKINLKSVAIGREQVILKETSSLADFTMTTQITIRKYQPQDHKVVCRMFAKGKEKYLGLYLVLTTVI